VKASIIIVNYNTFTLTCNCIESIREKSSGFDFEIILVDNGSTDHKAKEFKVRYPEINLITNESNLGFSKAVNQGIEYAIGEFILLINSDCILENNAIGICIDFLKKNPGLGVVTGKLISPDGTFQNNCQRIPSVKLKLIELLRLQKLLSREKAGELLLGPFFQYDRVVYPDWIWGTFFMFHRRLLNLLPENKLSDRFFLYGEDYEWCMNFRHYKIKVSYNPDAEIVHLMSQSMGDKNHLMDVNVNELLDTHFSGFERVLIKTLNFLLCGRYSYY
jgi:GT2 family glycosyltransferase